MPPKVKIAKVKGKKSTGTKKKIQIEDDGNPKEMPKAQLERVITALRQELEITKKDRNFYQLERDKISQYWEITRQQLNEARGEVQSIDREKEKKEEEHQRCLKVNNFKVKYLIHEQLENVAEMQAAAIAAAEVKQKEFDDQMLNLYQDKKVLQEQKLEMQRMHQEEVRALKMELTEKLSREREQLKSTGQDIEEIYGARIKEQREAITNRFNMELAEVEERKNQQISELLKNHESSFEELKAFYDDNSLKQLALISSLKEQMGVRKLSEERMAAALKEMQNENTKLSQDLQLAQNDVADLSCQLKSLRVDKWNLVTTKKRLTATAEKLDTVQWQREALLLQNSRYETERCGIQIEVKSAVQEAQLKAGIKTALFERKLQNLKNILQKRETQCADLLHAVQIGPDANCAVRLGKLLSEKSATIISAEEKLAQVIEVHNFIMDECRMALLKFGVSHDALSELNLFKIKATGNKIDWVID